MITEEENVSHSPSVAESRMPVPVSSYILHLMNLVPSDLFSGFFFTWFLSTPRMDCRGLLILRAFKYHEQIEQSSV